MKKGQKIILEVAKVGAIAGMGAAKQLADKNLYIIGAGVGLLFGKKASLNTMGTLVVVSSVWNAARYVSGDLKPRD